METYEVKLFVGANEGSEPVLTQEELEVAIRNQQRSPGVKVLPLRISPVTFMAGEYREEGWEILASSYPRRKLSPFELEAEMTKLGQYLLTALNQDRISLVTPHQTTILQK